MKKTDEQNEMNPKKESTGGGEITEPGVNSEYLNMSFWVDNKTNTTFMLEDSELQFGKWMESPKSIKPNSDWQLPFRSCGRAYTSSGTEGWVRYSSDRSKAKFLVRWDIPFGARKGYLTINCEGDACNSYKFDNTLRSQLG